MQLCLKITIWPTVSSSRVVCAYEIVGAVAVSITKKRLNKKINTGILFLSGWTEYFPNGNEQNLAYIEIVRKGMKSHGSLTPIPLYI